MTNIESVKNKLIYPNGYAILPYAVIDTPLPFTDFEIQEADIDGNLVGTGTYHSVSTLSAELGKLLVPVTIIDERFFIIRYGMDWDTVPQVTAFLEASGLNNVRANADGTYKLVSELDFTTFVGNEFMIIPVHMVNDVPKYIPTEVIA